MRVSDADVLKLSQATGTFRGTVFDCDFNISHEQVYQGCSKSKIKIDSPHSSENRLYVDQPLQTTIKPQDKKRCLAMAPQLFLQSTNHRRSKYGNFPYTLILSIT